MFYRIAKIPAVISSGSSKPSVGPKKSKKEKGTFVVGKSVLGEGDLI